MRHILARNVNEALSIALFNLVQFGERRESRNGPVLAFPYPVMTEYVAPRERVLFSPKRNANPVFHLLESLWMLAGRNDVKFVATLVKRMKEFSDNGEILWGAYGWRWRQFFGYDQLEHIIEELRSNPTSRRCVLQMWNGMDTPLHGSGKFYNDDTLPDLKIATTGGKDVPCNTAIYFDMRDGRLNMTITNRSNDILWGAYGANAVHMSMLQEYVALSVGVPVGRMWQFSNDLHLYTNTLHDLDITPMALEAHTTNYYSDRDAYVEPAPLIAEWEHIEDFNSDLETFFDRFDGRDDGNGLGATAGHFYRTQFFNFVVVPMVAAWCNRKDDPERALEHAKMIGAPDWQRATVGWITRNFVKDKVIA